MNKSDNQPVFGFWVRKIFHLVSNGFFAVLALVIPEIWVKPLAIGVFIIVVLFELIRLKSAAKKLLHGVIKGVFKHKEEVQFSGLFWASFGVTLVALFSSPVVVSFSLAILALPDSLASMVGKSFPSQKIYYAKTMYGAFTFFIVAFIVCLLYSGFLGMPTYRVIWSIITALIITIVETFSYPFDDNIAIPIFAATILHYSYLIPIS